MAKSKHGRQPICAMSENDADKSSKRILEPIERISEGIFRLIKVLGFTGSKRAAQDGSADIRTMAFGASGCNLAWGLIDGILYLMACLGEQWGLYHPASAGRPAVRCAGQLLRQLSFLWETVVVVLSWIHGRPAEAGC
jgi:hypothetical protein